MDLTIRQAVLVWSDLEQALAGTHGYGGDTAEIYAYRLMPYEVTLATGAREAAAVGARVAARNLYELLRLFEEERHAEIYVHVGRSHDGVRLDAGLLADNFTHRIHVRVKAKGGAA